MPCWRANPLSESRSWIFAIEGIVTVIVGVTAYWWVPGYPKDATFLNEREHAILIDRLRKGSDSADTEPFDWEGVCKSGLLRNLPVSYTMLTLACSTQGTHSRTPGSSVTECFSISSPSRSVSSSERTGPLQFTGPHSLTALPSRQTRSPSSCRRSLLSSATPRGVPSS